MTSEVITFDVGEKMKSRHTYLRDFIFTMYSKYVLQVLEIKNYL